MAGYIPVMTAQQVVSNAVTSAAISRGPLPASSLAATQAYRIEPEDVPASPVTFEDYEPNITKTTMGHPILAEPEPVKKPSLWGKFIRLFKGQGQHKKPRKGIK